VFITVNVDEIFKEVQIGKRIGPTSELWRFLMSKAKQEEWTNEVGRKPGESGILECKCRKYFEKQEYQPCQICLI
jgi:hypothetical protein